MWIAASRSWSIWRCPAAGPGPCAWPWPGHDMGGERYTQHMRMAVRLHSRSRSCTAAFDVSSIVDCVWESIASYRNVLGLHGANPRHHSRSQPIGRVGNSIVVTGHAKRHAGLGLLLAPVAALPLEHSGLGSIHTSSYGTSAWTIGCRQAGGIRTPVQAWQVEINIKLGRRRGSVRRRLREGI